MKTIEIQRSQWPTFFDSFSRRHEGWLASLEIISPEFGAQFSATQLPLEGVTAELKSNNQDQIAILFSGQNAGHITHTVNKPTQVMVEQTDAGADEALQIESSEGQKILLRFRVPALPEAVDGLVIDPG